ncbi:MAG: succinate dehydrogenase, hydrophobic membrane anchor protein [Gammaproteobacteria bacterium]|nr:succinate dehydrogenase, hydrophobic membrane anchor protein [Gammaproteobacteria bacterium]
MSLRTPLGKFLGHGSAGHGSGHWWLQRLSAVALLPLTVWIVVSFVGLGGYDYATVTGWMAEPLHAILLAALLIAMLQHSQLGLQVIIEDYVHTGWLKVGALVMLKLAHALLGIAGLYAVIVISLRAIS